MKVLDVSGYSFSGKSAIYDLLEEFDGYCGQGKEFEFDLLRASGGVLDLEFALIRNWSPVRSSEAIRRFGILTRNFGGDGRGLSRLTRLGTYYEKHFPGFESFSKKYLEELCDVEWESYWPFVYFDAGKMEIFWRKTLARLFRIDTMRSRVVLARPDAMHFHKVTRSYLRTIFGNFQRPDCRTLVLNNAFEPFAPENSINLFDDARCIVVDRDPRDIYLSALRAGRVGNTDVGRAVTGETVGDFIARFRIYRCGDYEENPRVLRLRFEDLIENYEETVAKILRFLDESPSTHVRKGAIFKPSLSAQGIGQWQKATGEERIAVKCIENELQEYCC